MRGWMMAIALFFPFVSACVPVPEYVRVRPEISGSIVKQGRPVAGALVCFCDIAAQALASPCAGNQSATRTDDAGVFRLEGEGSWVIQRLDDPESPPLPMGHSDTGYGGSICVEAQDAPPESARWSNLGYVPKRFDAECNLSMEAEKKRYLGGPCLLTRH